MFMYTPKVQYVTYVGIQAEFGGIAALRARSVLPFLLFRFPFRFPFRPVFLYDVSDNLIDKMTNYVCTV